MTVRFGSKLVRVLDYACAGAVRGPSSAETTRRYEIVFVRRGGFALWTHRRERLLTPNEVLLLAPDSSYSASHPIAGGDACTIVECSPDLLEPLLDGRRGLQVAAASAALFHRQASLFALLGRPSASDLEVEEWLFAVISESLRQFDPSFDRRMEAAPARQRRYVRRAKEILAAHYAEALPLPAIAALSGVSPFHLSRLFRELTGTTLHRYQTSLRLRAATEKLLAGFDDLTALALDLGFSSHSHFTAAFRREFGVRPAWLRHTFGPPAKTATRRG